MNVLDVYMFGQYLSKSFDIRVKYKKSLNTSL